MEILQEISNDWIVGKSAINYNFSAFLSHTTAFPLVPSLPGALFLPVDGGAKYLEIWNSRGQISSELGGTWDVGQNGRPLMGPQMWVCLV